MNRFRVLIAVAALVVASCSSTDGGLDLAESVARHMILTQFAPYFEAQERESFYEDVPIVFRLDDPEEHYHVPLLLSPFGYSTYRGS